MSCLGNIGGSPDRNRLPDLDIGAASDGSNPRRLFMTMQLKRGENAGRQQPVDQRVVRVHDNGDATCFWRRSAGEGVQLVKLKMTGALGKMHKARMRRAMREGGVKRCRGGQAANLDGDSGHAVP